MTETELVRSKMPGLVREIELARFTTWAIGGRSMAAFPGDENTLGKILELAEDSGVRWTILGRGSNTLAPSSGWNGLVVILSGGFRNHCFQGETLFAGAAAPLPSVAGAACCRGLRGLTFAVGIPGTIGGAVFMNAGAYGGSIGKLIVKVNAVTRDGSRLRMSGSECEFSYRSSVFQRSGAVVTGAELKLAVGEAVPLRKRASELLALRRDKYPVGVPNAGSVFKRPEQGPPPGKLIEDAGLKGYSVGGARVSPVHANFIENTGGATSDHVLRLMDHVGERVLKLFGIELKREIRILGEDA